MPEYSSAVGNSSLGILFPWFQSAAPIPAAPPPLARMADNWEDEADSLTTGVPLPVALKTDRWEGEDEEDVPDAWDAEPAAPAAAASAPAAAADKKPAATTKPKKGKKALAEALEKKKAEAEERKKQPAADAISDSAGVAPGLSAEEQRKIQEESDLLIAKDTFGVNDTAKVAAAAGLDPEKSIDMQQPSSKEDFDRLSRLLSQKLRGFEASPHYAGFIEGVYRECALELDQECLRRLSTMFTALAAEKQKMQKSAKGKPKKTKGTLKVERDPAGAIGGEDYDQYDDFDDFM